MKSYDFDFMTGNSSIYCGDCIREKKIPIDSLLPIFADSEWDYYPVCDICGAVDENINFIPAIVKESDKPALTIDYDSGVEVYSAIDQYGIEYRTYDRDALAEEYNFCELCGILVESGYVCLDGGEVFCSDCVVELN